MEKKKKSETQKCTMLFIRIAHPKLELGGTKEEVRREEKKEASRPNGAVIKSSVRKREEKRAARSPGWRSNCPGNYSASFEAPLYRCPEMNQRSFLIISRGLSFFFQIS